MLILGAAAPVGAVGQPVAPSQEEREALDQLRASGPGGEIVFASRRDGKWRLFRIYSDGGNLVRLSQGIANHTRPFFVLGGSKLVFHSDEDGPVQIWMAEPDLSKPRRLSPAGQQEWFQGMTGDGKLMLVARQRHKDQYLLRNLVDGSETPVVFADPSLGGGYLDGMLSPDGRRIVYLYKDGGPGEPDRGLYAVDLNPDGRTANPRTITVGCGTSWRSDSQAFLASRFLTFRGGPGTEVWLCGPQGPIEKLTSNLDWNYAAAFSPDEQWMVWAASPLYSHDPASGRYEIYVKRLRDRNPIRLTFHTATDMDPTWRAQRSQLKGHQADFVYEAEDYTHQPAAVLDDPQASGGRAAGVHRAVDRAGAVVYGQYDVLPAGQYQARFRLRLANVQRQGLVAELDVSVEGGQRVLAKRSLRAEEFTSGRYRDFDLVFNSDQLLTALECRVSFYPGVADLVVDVITVKPYHDPAWHQRAWDWASGLFGDD
jgi:hypothetical protein